MNNVQPFRPAGYVEDNPLGLPKDYVKKILPHLDAHIASLFVLFHQYQKHHWLVEGPQFMDLHKFLQGNYEQVHKQIDMLAERMTALGGIPTCNPVEQAKIAYFDHEPEGTYRIRHMLERDLEAEGILARKLRETIRVAAEQDPGTEQLLKSILHDLEDRAHHLHHFLGEDSLELGLNIEAAAATTNSSLPTSPNGSTATKTGEKVAN
jgi:DNA-binding ferritin-like protein